MSAPMYDCHILEDNGSFKVWEKKVLHNVFPVTGLAGKACQTGKPTLKPFPCINDKLKDKFGNDTDIWLFDLEPYSGQGIVKQTLTAQGLRDSGNSRKLLQHIQASWMPMRKMVTIN